MDMLIQNFFNIEILVVSWPMLVEGLKMTALLTLFVVPLGFFGGLFLAVLYNLRYWWLRWPIVFYVDFFRAFPPLVLLILIYSCLPFLGIRLSEFATVVVALVANGSAFFGEIVRAGIESVGRGQREAARSTGIGPAGTMVFVVLPQALRNVVPPLASNMVELAKATSFAAVVAMPDLLRNARTAQDIVYNPTPLMAAAVIYLAVFWPAVRLLSRLEQRMILARR